MKNITSYNLSITSKFRTLTSFWASFRLSSFFPQFYLFKTWNAHKTEISNCTLAYANLRKRNLPWTSKWVKNLFCMNNYTFLLFIGPFFRLPCSRVTCVYLRVSKRGFILFIFFFYDDATMEFARLLIIRPIIVCHYVIIIKNDDFTFFHYT